MTKFQGLSLYILLCVVSSSTAINIVEKNQRSYFCDTFEDQDISDWDDASGSHTAAVSSFAANDTDRALTLSGGINENYMGLYQTFSARQPEYISTWIASSNANVSDAYFVLSGNNSLSQRVVFLYFSESGDIRLYQDSAYSCGSYVENQYYHIELIIDWDLSLFDVYVDGILHHSNLPFRDADTTNIDRINLYNYQNSVAYWDEIYCVDSLATCDDFERENGTTVANWTEEAGDWFISETRLAPERTATRQYITFDNSERINGSVQGRFLFGSGTSLRFAGLVARYTDTNNGLLIKLQNQSTSDQWSNLFVSEDGSNIWGVSGNFGTDALMAVDYSGTDLQIRLDTDRNGVWDYTYSVTVNTIASGRSGCSGYGQADDMYIDDWCYHQSSISVAPPAQGGPDDFGHIWTTFQSFDWHDMSSATDTGVTGDDATGGPFDIGFDFDWYGNTYSQFYLSTNGIVGFYPVSETRHYCGNFGPTSQNNLITCGGDRAIFSEEGGEIRFRVTGASPRQQCIIEFTKMRYNYSNDTEFFDMQVVLNENGGIGEEAVIAFENTATCSNTTALIGVESASGNDYMILNDTCPNAFYEGLAMTVSLNEMLPGMPIDLSDLTPYSGNSIEINGSTFGGGDDYSENYLINCWEDSDSREDFFYFTPEDDLSLQIDLIGSGYDTQLAILAPDIHGDELCIFNDDWVGAPGHLSGFECLTFTANTTYTLIISGWANSQGDYTLNFEECESVRPTATPTATATPTPLPTMTATPTTVCINSGDVDFSGNLTAGDAQTTFFIVLGTMTPTSEEQCAADCDGNGSITAGDAQMIFLSVLGSGSCADPV